MSAHSSYPAGRGHIDHDDEVLVRALRDRDEQVFNELVECWSGVMLRLALTHGESRAIAEEVVQDAWLTVLRSLDRFERPVLSSHLGAGNRRELCAVTRPYRAARGPSLV